jgi:hypothetical protein
MSVDRMHSEYQPVTAKYYYYTSDQINFTRIITNSSGAVVYSALFDPYGGMQKQWVNIKPTIWILARQSQIPFRILEPMLTHLPVECSGKT